MKPFFYLIAGPSGVGKSTAAFQFLPVGVEFIDADDIAHQLHVQQVHQEVAQHMAHDESQRRIQRHLRNRTAFAVETNLHDIETWQYYLAIQQAGYEFRLLFLCVDDLPILYQRVRNRQLQGGQFVREDVIRGRYVAGLSLLNHFFDNPDSLTLIDSSDRLALVYQRVDGDVLHIKKSLPAWITTHLSSHFT
ncbi:MAG TPA: AAA family ATPase [Fibrella sp.]